MPTHPLPVKLTIGPIIGTDKLTFSVRGMFGIGDCLFQRAILRELMQKHSHITLESYYRDMFWDLEKQNLSLEIVEDRGRIRDSRNRSDKKGVAPVRLKSTKAMRLTYDRTSILQHGSILAAMYQSVGLTMPDKPDFSLPVQPEWLARWRLWFKTEQSRLGFKVNKPILVYRPIVLNNRWTAPARSPDPKAYNELYQSIREKFFVIGIADLKDDTANKEWIVGPKPNVDLELYHGQLNFAAMCGLFADATMVFGNPGFVPVLAQAIGTPNVIVYGGNESFATTNIVGKHLAPTCAIDIDNPCACHQQTHRCDKTITLPPAKKKVLQFTQTVLQNGASKQMGIADMFKKNADRVVSGQSPGKGEAQAELDNEKTTAPKVLIFGTMYADTPERATLTKFWYELHSAINPDCDLLLVDSKSPSFPSDLIAGHDESTISQAPLRSIAAHVYSSTANSAHKGLTVIQYLDNVGHLSRNGLQGPKSLGRDGWGRAFTRGLDYACTERNPSPEVPQRRYDYVVHIEGDSLFKHPVLPIVERMRRDGLKCTTVPVKGTRQEEKHWVETGLMFFDTEYLQTSKFTERYDWPNRQVHPTPERVIHTLLEADNVLGLKSWVALRGDKNQITKDNIFNLDWVTHVRNKVGLDDVRLYQQYVDYVMRRPPSSAPVPNLVPGAGVPAGRSPVGDTAPAPTAPSNASVVGAGPVMLNFGCGTNKLEGWQNFDAEININHKLPFKDNYADFIFAEHVVEHTTYYKAVDFFKECLRVLKPGGVLRITTPSLERIYKHGDEEYFKFAHDRKWAPTNDRRGAMHAILYCHGHETAWTDALLRATIYYCGFEDVILCESGSSVHKQLSDVEGHHKVIGAKFNWIESISVEGTKPL